MTGTVFLLLIAFQLKHLIADYYMQEEYMYKDKGKPTGFIKALSDHAKVHGLWTITILFAASYWIEITLATILIAGLFDYLTHMVVDRWKAVKKHTPDTTVFWTTLGLDQMWHHIVGIVIIYNVI